MSQKIEDILMLLGNLRAEYRRNPSTTVRELRIAAVRNLAEKRHVEPNTIADAYIRRLAPEIRSTSDFDHVVERWLASNDDELQSILQLHALNARDPQLIRNFFERQ